MAEWLSIDFETRSTVNLPDTGVYVYAEHPTTDVWLMSYAFDDGPIERWLLGDPFSETIRAHLAAGGKVRAWNAAFERIVWNWLCMPRYGWPELPLEQVYCTMAQGALNGLPRSLEDAAAALKLPLQKDMSGRRLMLQMARPRGRNRPKIVCERCEGSGSETGDGLSVLGFCPDCGGEGFRLGPEEIIWWDDEDRRKKLYAYCDQDVRTERAIANKLWPMSAFERRVWLLDQRANDRGITVDVRAVDEAEKLAEQAQRALHKAMREATGGHVETTQQVQKLIEWLAAQGVETASVDADTLEALLAQDDLPAHVRRALQIRQEAARSSVKKLKKLRAYTCADGRARGMLLYGGAPRTLRWSGAGPQPQNFVRPLDHDHPHHVDTRILDALRLGLPGPLLSAAEKADEGVLWAIAQTLRGFFTAAPGRLLVACDFSAIEARVLAWLAQEEWRLEVFRTHGKIYEASAATMFGIPIEECSKGGSRPELRQRGKVAELALGYQGWVGALTTMGGAKLGMTDEQMVDTCQRWRERSPNIVAFWKACEAATKAALLHPGELIPFGPLRNLTACRLPDALVIQLPSSRCLVYRNPRLELYTKLSWPGGATTVRGQDPGEILKAITERVPEEHRGNVREEPTQILVYDGVDATTKQWGAISTYGGKTTENVDQAAARDFLAAVMLRAEEHPRLQELGFELLLTVHDEIVGEAPAEHAEECLAILVELMSTPEAWAARCPMGAAGWVGPRYGKG